MNNIQNVTNEILENYAIIIDDAKNQKCYCCKLAHIPNMYTFVNTQISPIYTTGTLSYTVMCNGKQSSTTGSVIYEQIARFLVCVSHNFTSNI